MSRARIAKLSLVLLAAVALIAVIVFASIDQRALTERVVRRFVAESSETLGREITFDSARGQLLPSPRVTIEGVKVAGRPGEPALLEADELYVHLRIWPIVRSLGREIAIDEVAVARPSVHLVRDAEGSWNFEGLGPQEGSPRAEIRYEQVSLEDGTVRVIDASTPGRETSVALTDLDVRAEDAAPLPARLSLRGALASEQQNLAVDLRMEEREGPPALEGTIALDDAALARLDGLIPGGVANVVRGGRVSVDADVATGDDGKYEVRATASLEGVRLRSGEPARGEVRMSTRIDPESPGKLRADIGRLALSGPGIELTGRASFTNAPRSLTFDVAGPLLDLDLLLAALPEGEARGEDEGVLPPSLRRNLARTAARGTLRFERVVRGNLELRDVVARARLRGGEIEIEQGEAGLYGGRVVATGTRADLRPAVPEWTLRARLEGVDVGAMAQAISSDQPLVGRLEGTIDVSGSGAAWEHVRRSASGTAAVGIHDGALTTGDVGAQVLSVAADALRLAGREEVRVERAASGRTELDDVRLAFRVEDGALVLRQPLVADLPFGRASLRGRIGLDRSLDLEGRVTLAPEVVSSALGIQVREPLDIPLAIGGTLRAPTIAPGSPEAIAQELTGAAVREGTRRLQEEVEGEIEDRAGDLLRDLGGQIFRGP